jgi:hypothetical protein
MSRTAARVLGDHWSTASHAQDASWGVRAWRAGLTSAGHPGTPLAALREGSSPEGRRHRLVAPSPLLSGDRAWSPRDAPMLGSAAALATDGLCSYAVGAAVRETRQPAPHRQAPAAGQEADTPKPRRHASLWPQAPAGWRGPVRRSGPASAASNAGGWRAGVPVGNRDADARSSPEPRRPRRGTAAQGLASPAASGHGGGTATRRRAGRGAPPARGRCPSSGCAT